MFALNGQYLGQEASHFLRTRSILPAGGASKPWDIAKVQVSNCFQVELIRHRDALSDAGDRNVAKL